MTIHFMVSSRRDPALLASAATADEPSQQAEGAGAEEDVEERVHGGAVHSTAIPSSA